MTGPNETTSESSNYEKSLQTSEQYAKLFKDVPALSSKDLVSLMQARNENSTDTDDFLIVDVRSKSEQAISMIPGSLPLKKFKKDVLPSLVPSEKTVIFYCTVGYRSGLNARYFQEKYSLNVKNLDGIVSYTHAISECIDDNEKKCMLINPKANTETNKVHCYGKTWNYVDKQFEPVFFSKYSLFCKTSKVGFLSFLRYLQHMSFSIRSCVSSRSQNES